MKCTSRDSRSSFADGDGARLAFAAGLSQRGGELRQAIEGVGALARLDLGELGDDLEPLGLGEPSYSRALGVQPSPDAPAREC